MSGESEDLQVNIRPAGEGHVESSPQRGANPGGGALRSDVQGVVLAGVHAWGENVLDRVICRPLVRVAARPLICHTLAWLRQGGVVSASVCANSDTVHLRRQLGDGAQLDIALDYYEDVMPRGPAGCARDVATGTDCGTFLVVEGTIFPKIDLDDLLRAHERSGAVLTVVVAAGRTGDPGPNQSLEPVGMYVFSRGAFEHVPGSGYQDIKESLIPRLYAKGQRVQSYVVDSISTPAVKGVASYLAVNEWAVEQLVRSEAPAGYQLRGQTLVHSTAVVAPTARLLGPVWVESGTLIGGDALIIGPTVIGTGSRIGDGAVISRSAIWERCIVAGSAVVDQCIVTDEGFVSSAGAVRHQVIVPERMVGRSALGRLLRRGGGQELASELRRLQEQEEQLTRRLPGKPMRQPVSAASVREDVGSAPRVGVS